jgi:hypothetical protein
MMDREVAGDKNKDSHKSLDRSSVLLEVFHRVRLGDSLRYLANFCDVKVDRTWNGGLALDHMVAVACTSRARSHYITLVYPAQPRM